MAAAGSVHAVSPELVGSYPFARYVELDPFLCRELRIGAAATAFIRTPDGSIYHLVGGEKRPIASMARFAQVSGGQGWLNVVPQFAAAIPTGPLA